MSRTLVGTSNTVYVTFYVGETATDADGAVTATVKDAAGSTISTGPATNEPGVGNYSYVVPAVANPALMTIVWTGTFSSVVQTITEPLEACEAFLFSLSDLRGMDGLASTTTFPTVLLAQTREDVMDLFNHYCHTAWGETFKSESFDGDEGGGAELQLTWLPSRRVLAVYKDGAVAPTTGWVVDASGLITPPDGELLDPGRQNYRIEYTYGHGLVHGDVKRAARRLARTWLLSGESSIPDRARMMTTEWGTFQLTNATEEFPTGLPEVDSVLNRYRRHQFVIA